MGVKWDNGESMNESDQSDHLWRQGSSPEAAEKALISRPSTVPGLEGLQVFRLQHH